MKPSRPSSWFVTICPEAAATLWQAECVAGRSQPLSVSVTVSVLAPAYSPVPVPAEHVIFFAPVVSSVTAPSWAVNLFAAPGPGRKS